MGYLLLTKYQIFRISRVVLELTLQKACTNTYFWRKAVAPKIIKLYIYVHSAKIYLVMSQHDEVFFLTDVTHSWASAGPNCLIWRLCHSPIQYVVMTRIRFSWQTILINNSVTVCFCALLKYVFHIDCAWETNAD